MISNRDIAIAAAAELALAHLNLSIRATPATSLLLEQAIVPIFGIRWSAQALRRVGTSSLNEILCLLRNSPLSQASYARLAQLWKDALLVDPANFPLDWEIWRSLIENFNLDERFPLVTWIPVAQWCLGHNHTSPPTLALATAGALTLTATDFSPQSQLHLLWRTSVIAFADHSPATTARLTGSSRCAEDFRRHLKATDLKSSHSAKRIRISCERLRLERTFLTLCPSAKLQALRQAGAPLSAVNAFFRHTSQFHALRGVRLCYRSFASGIRLYFSFCELKNVRPSPVRECVVLQRSALFKPRDTFRSYVNFLRKACFYIGGPTD